MRVHIIAAENLPDTDTAFFNIDGKDVTDPYVTGDLGFARILKVNIDNGFSMLTGPLRLVCLMYCDLNSGPKSEICVQQKIHQINVWINNDWDI